ncbi:MAG: class I SAM-dependent methyltransferase [Myxococcales bacterium]|nr:class I SAM-dependent methyltransferase [Myxococcales bacterium]
MFERAVISITKLVLAILCRALDLLMLAVRPRLVGPYLSVWLAERRRSPYRWPRSFETVLLLKQTGHTARELTYGEIPLLTAVLLFRRAGLGPGGRLVDLGAGRGRALLAARWLGAQARGVELRREHVEAVRPAMARAGAHLEVADATEADLTGATHVFANWCAFGEESRRRIAERLLACPSGTRLISVLHPAPGGQLRALCRRPGLFTWGFEWVWIHER